jgi:hypothetical protein
MSTAYDEVKTPEVDLALVGKERPVKLNDLTTLFDVIEFSDGSGMAREYSRAREESATNSSPRLSTNARALAIVVFCIATSHQAHLHSEASDFFGVEPLSSIRARLLSVPSAAVRAA